MKSGMQTGKHFFDCGIRIARCTLSNTGAGARCTLSNTGAGARCTLTHLVVVSYEV